MNAWAGNMAQTHCCRPLASKSLPVPLCPCPCLHMPMPLFRAQSHPFPPFHQLPVGQHVPKSHLEVHHAFFKKIGKLSWKQCPALPLALSSKLQPQPPPAPPALLPLAAGTSLLAKAPRSSSLMGLGKLLPVCARPAPPGQLFATRALRASMWWVHACKWAMREAGGGAHAQLTTDARSLAPVRPCARAWAILGPLASTSSPHRSIRPALACMRVPSAWHVYQHVQTGAFDPTDKVLHAFPVSPSQHASSGAEVTACASCFTVTDCGEYTDGKDQPNIGTGLTTNDVCPLTSTRAATCKACAAGFYAVGGSLGLWGWVGSGAQTHWLFTGHG